MYIKDLADGEIRIYGTNPHDALRISENGRNLSYENLQNGDGSRFGDYRFCDENGKVPEEDEELMRHGADAYFNISGFNKSSDGSDNTYDKGMTDTINALFGFIEDCADGICDTVMEEYSDWCENNCNNLCEECVKKYVRTLSETKFSDRKGK